MLRAFELEFFLYRRTNNLSWVTKFFTTIKASKTKREWKSSHLKLRLFRGKIFFITKCFQMKMIWGKMIFFIFFSVFGCISKNGPENILQCRSKDIAEWAGDETCVFGKWFTKKLSVNHFPNFNKEFSGQRKLFSVWPLFYSETNTHKFENIFQKIFYSETNGA